MSNSSMLKYLVVGLVLIYHVQSRISPLGKVKGGFCPPKSGAGICVEMCSNDQSCPGREKCCSNGCGHVCMHPTGGIKPSPGKVKGGFCPPKSGAGICVEMCSNDQSCPGREKCCSNGCGHVCMHPTGGIKPSPVCEKGRPLTHIQCGFPSPTSGTCPKGYYCKMHPFNNKSVCCQIPCPHGDPHPTRSCGMFAGSNSCPYGYTCLSHPADAYFACCPNRHG